MAQPITSIHIDHQPAIHEVEAHSSDAPTPLTLLELIDAVSAVSESETEVIATVTYMLKSGRIRLTGNFRDTPVAMLTS